MSEYLILRMEFDIQSVHAHDAYYLAKKALFNLRRVRYHCAKGIRIAYKPVFHYKNCPQFEI